jgi:hypothetical protein
VSSLILRLAHELVSWMDTAPDGIPRRVLLWLDPDCAFKRLSTHLATALKDQGTVFHAYDPPAGRGQLWLKLELLRLEAQPEARAVVYLPGFNDSAFDPRPQSLPRLWGIFEYRYKGCIWGQGKSWKPEEVPRLHTLVTWLRRHGVSFADEATRKELAKGGTDSLLARYVEAMRETDPTTWPAPLRTSDVLAALGGDPKEHLRALLAAPANAFRRWQAEQISKLALGRIAEEFGLALPDGNEDPEQLADSFAVQLALAEAFEAFGEPGDFPYRSRLPERAEHRRRAAAFVRDELIPHMELGPRFLQRMRRIERDYPLAEWAAGRYGQPVGLPLLAEQRLRRLLDRLEEHVGRNWQAAAELLDAEETAIEAGAGLADEDIASGWIATRHLHELFRAIQKIEERLDTVKDAAAAIRLYSDEAWRADLLYLNVRASCAKAHGLEVVRLLADVAYFQYVSRLADRFFDFVEHQGFWPPDVLTGVESIRHALWSKARRRKAVIVVDSLRLDLARMLEQCLDSEVSLEALGTTLPTNTPFGMTALLPLSDASLTVSFESGKASISAGGVSGLETREGRKAFLRQAIGGAKGTGIEFVDLTALLRRNSDSVSESPFVVVFDNSIDEQGHKGTDQFPLLVEQFVSDLRRAILRLHEAGMEEVHVVTDHGFLMLPAEMVDGLGRPELPPAQAIHKDIRWAVLKPGAPVTDLVALPLPLAPEAATLGFPRGARTLVKAEGYLHGGISLQECVVPHLVSRLETHPQLFDVEVGVTSDRLTTGVVPVVLKPKVEGQLALTKVRTVNVRLWVETPAESGLSRQQVTEPIDVPVHANASELRPPLYLKEGLHLSAGQKLLLRAVDQDTGRELATVALTLDVDWE